MVVMKVVLHGKINIFYIYAVLKSSLKPTKRSHDYRQRSQNIHGNSARKELSRTNTIAKILFSRNY